MTQSTAAILADALRLDERARAELVAEWLASFDGPEDVDAAAQWATEIERRVVSVDAGTVVLEAWDDVRSRIEREVLGR